MLNKKGLFHYIAIVFRWARPRCVPAIVFLMMLPTVVITRVCFGGPIWIVAFVVAMVKKFIFLQRRRQQKPMPLN
ncbi:MAG: hypothetical protein HEQ17_00460 [Limnohabitans sp.]|jgi:hypothetical protein|uniref:hypothetical protein n=1 Tax=Limnohabitans sp. TaxID=1907725 RepID=UPI0026013D0D|nr:hypothetical protein [Limnohabitans sp.]MCO4087484.1 hypothetical protein [Limnohabitans sp.]